MYMRTHTHTYTHTHTHTHTHTSITIPADGSDYQSLNGTAAQLVWTANSTRACITIPILDDQTVENDEVFFVNMVRIVTPLANPTLALPTIVMIMNDDGMLGVVHVLFVHCIRMRAYMSLPPCYMYLLAFV